MIDESISIESIMNAVPEKYRSYIWIILDIDCLPKKGTMSSYIYDYAEKGFGFITSWDVLNEVIIPDFGDIAHLWVACCSDIKNLQGISQARKEGKIFYDDIIDYLDFSFYIEDGIIDNFYAKKRQDFNKLVKVIREFPRYVEPENPGDMRRGRAEPLEK